MWIKIISIAALFVLFLSSCAASSELSIEDLSVYDKTTKAYISLGMQKKEVDKILGSPKQFEQDESSFSYDNLIITYSKRDFRVTTITLFFSLLKEDRFLVGKKVGIMSNVSDVLTNNNAVTSNRNEGSITYFYLIKGNSVKYIDAESEEFMSLLDPKKTKSFDKLYSISYSFDKENHITAVLINDSTSMYIISR